ncbi:hypothetical protein LTR09_005775 [Extremus antarcticus]|uniref:Uncharacterized protein n=1 Tax=Extremus antarcticus TaxID=702011 RepID=A0AAJ0GC62_9PEZI|nr:hypothetical protein LTR09_005775 [Extremus antarcticus]
MSDASQSADSIPARRGAANTDQGIGDKLKGPENRGNEVQQKGDDGSVQNDAAQGEPVQSGPEQDQPAQEKAVHGECAQDDTAKDEAAQTEPVPNERLPGKDAQGVQHEADTDKSVHDDTVQDEVVEKEAVPEDPAQEEPKTASDDFWHNFNSDLLQQFGLTAGNTRSLSLFSTTVGILWSEDPNEAVPTVQNLTTSDTSREDLLTSLSMALDWLVPRGENDNAPGRQYYREKWQAVAEEGEFEALSTSMLRMMVHQTLSDAHSAQWQARSTAEWAYAWDPDWSCDEQLQEAGFGGVTQDQAAQ